MSRQRFLSTITNNWFVVSIAGLLGLLCGPYLADRSVSRFAPTR
ncbi:MAG: hypothetical protein Q8M73_05795 [Actinomycetota bacterium]|nr:hypothetical protein [Actinomycetota bacterium]